MRKNRNYWTKERCLENAKKYNGRAEFKRMSGGAYNSAKKNKWLDECCANMKYVGNRFIRCVYIYEFSDKSVYVGLTYNINERGKKHMRAKDSMVFRYMKKTGLIPKLTHTDYMNVEDSKKIEGEILNKFKNDGYNILNISKTGGVGGGYIKWTFDKCKDDALKYTTRKEYFDKSGSSYNSAKRYGWLDDVCSHMSKKEKKPKCYWTLERCKKESKKYLTKGDLYKNSSGAYNAIIKNNWEKETFEHMIEKHKRNGYWTKERCKDEALKYKTKKEFREGSNSVYSTSCRKGWLVEICEHMKKNN